VHNAAAGYWSIATGARSASLSLAGFDGTVAATVFAARPSARHGPVLCCVYDAALPPPCVACATSRCRRRRPLALCPSARPQPVARLAVRIGTRRDASTPVRRQGSARCWAPIRRALLAAARSAGAPARRDHRDRLDDQPPAAVERIPA